VICVGECPRPGCSGFTWQVECHTSRKSVPILSTREKGSRHRNIPSLHVMECRSIILTTLVVSALLAAACPSQFVPAPQFLIIQPEGRIPDTFATYPQVEEINHSLKPQLDSILHTDFFGYYRLNLYEATCPVSWGDSFPMCGNRACAVNTLDEVPSTPPPPTRRVLRSGTNPRDLAGRDTREGFRSDCNAPVRLTARVVGGAE
jgi:Endoplasmic Reticulum Oxidoreductin 1 (ERO1)